MLESLSRITDVKEVNVSRDERWASLAAGAVLLIYAIIRIPFSAVFAVVAASYLFFRGIRGFCYFYDRIGMNKAIDGSVSAAETKNNHRRETVVPSQQPFS